MRPTILLIALALTLPQVSAQDVALDGVDPETLLHDGGHLAESWLDYLEEHAECDPERQGQAQTDGVDSEGQPKACDAPDTLEELDPDRQVPINAQMRGFLAHGPGDRRDVDVYALHTTLEDARALFSITLDFGVDQAEVKLEELRFDVVTLEAESLFNGDAWFYESPPCEECQEPCHDHQSPGHEKIHEAKANHTNLNHWLKHHGDCPQPEDPVPGPERDGLSGSFHLPSQLAGQTLALIVSSVESSEPQSQSMSAEDEVADLFAPRPMSCDRDLCMFGEERQDSPLEYTADLLRHAA